VVIRTDSITQKGLPVGGPFYDGNERTFSSLCNKGTASAGPYKPAKIGAGFSPCAVVNWGRDSLLEDDAMGREAVCSCDWAGQVAEVKALLETGELILRGGMRKRVNFAAMKQVAVQDGELRFTVAGEKVQLVLGPSMSEKWADVITRPPAPLSRKLGISGTTVVRVVGEADSEELKGALAPAARISSTNADLIVACVDTLESLHTTLSLVESDVIKGVPIWMVYAKGPKLALNETAIRSLLRANGLMDTKVASVSAKFTALRFIRQRSE
jgi:hypothetical protein